MSDVKITETEAIDAFWEHVKEGTTVMVGINATDKHTQPMTTFPESHNNLIWFFTRDDTDFAKEVAGHPDARMILQSKDQDVQADVRGTFRIHRDQARIDKFWNPMVAAWYPDGKTDPHLTLLAFTPKDAQIWVSTKSFMALAFEVVKANITKEMPDAGGVADVNFAKRAAE